MLWVAFHCKVLLIWGIYVLWLKVSSVTINFSLLDLISRLFVPFSVKTRDYRELWLWLEILFRLLYRRDSWVKLTQSGMENHNFSYKDLNQGPFLSLSVKPELTYQFLFSIISSRRRSKNTTTTTRSLTSLFISDLICSMETSDFCYWLFSIMQQLSLTWLSSRWLQTQDPRVTAKVGVSITSIHQLHIHKGLNYTYLQGGTTNKKSINVFFFGKLCTVASVDRTWQLSRK